MKSRNTRKVRKSSNWVDFKAVKAAVSIEMVLDHYGIELNRKGDQLSGSCPIHDGSNPSQFSVSLQRNAFHCFSAHCGAQGNVLDFVALKEDISVREAALKIQNWFNLETGKDPPQEKEEPDHPSAEKAEKDAQNQPLTFRLKNLEPDHPYLETRSLTEETIDYFGLGYCSRGMMKGRIVIPIHNARRELVAYAGRTVEEVSEENPKYRLPPNFKKTLVVFNLHQVQRTHVVLVEGFFDVFTLWQAGILNVAALIGSSMSDEQEALILSLVGNHGRVTLMFDGDDSGRQCTREVTKRLIQKVYVKVVALKEGEQPDMLCEEEIKRLLI